MFTTYTYQDWLAAPVAERPKLALSIIAAYQASEGFVRALTALAYFDARNESIMAREKMQVNGSQRVGERNVAALGVVQGARISNRFFFRFVTQANQFLLANGLQLPDESMKAKLGAGFDKKLEQLGENALVCGAAWAFWNHDHVEVLKACDGRDNGFVALVDERSAEPMAGFQFWRVSTLKPLYFRVFELDGVSEYRVDNDVPVPLEAKRAYRQTVRVDALGTRVVGGGNYPTLPVVPLYANDRHASELTDDIKSKIDAYDAILSDFSDNLERTNDIYWVINNFGGTSDDVIAMLAEINRVKATYTNTEGGGHSTAEPHTIEVPYQARAMALDLLEKALYKDAMALNMQELTGGGLTNVAIKTATANLNLKVNRYEWQAYQFCQKLLRLAGIETEDIRFKRQTIANESELVQDIYTMRADISRKKALELNPYIQADEIEGILADVDAEETSGLPDMERLQAGINGE